MIPRRMMNKVQSGVFGDTGNKQPYQFGELNLRPSIFTSNHVTEVGPFILRAQRIIYVCSKILHKSHARATGALLKVGSKITQRQRREICEPGASAEQREARRPWIKKIDRGALKERNNWQRYFALSVLSPIYFCYPGATRFASLSACPWLSYRAPLALQAYRAPLAL